MRSLSKTAILRILCAFGVLLLFIIVSIRVVPLVFATNDFTVSNLSMNPATGRVEFDYTGSSVASSSPNIRIKNTAGTVIYWDSISSNLDECTSSHCVLTLFPAESDSGVSTVILKAGNGLESQQLSYPFDLPTSNTPQTVRYDTQLYTLSLSSGTSTTTNATASFGSVTLPVKSNVCVRSEWVLENDTNSLGITAILVLDSAAQSIFGDTVPLSASGIAFTIARNHCFSNVAAGSHTFAVKVDQYPFRSGDTVRIREGSKMWITAYPTQ